MTKIVEGLDIRNGLKSLPQNLDKSFMVESPSRCTYPNDMRILFLNQKSWIHNLCVHPKDEREHKPYLTTNYSEACLNFSMDKYHLETYLKKYFIG